jgi:hypothetical protein
MVFWEQSPSAKRLVMQFDKRKKESESSLQAVWKETSVFEFFKGKNIDILRNFR